MTDDQFSIESLQQLRDRVGYEDWLLESVYKLAEDELFPDWPDAVVYDLSSSAPVTTVHVRGHIVLGDWRPGFLDAGAPLVFTATFKLLDMLFEWVLERNGRKVDFGFSQKLRQLGTSGVALPDVLRSRPWLMERLKGLYKEAEPLRGTIIHSRHFASTDGTLRVASSKGGVVGENIELDASDLRTFAQLSVSVLRFLQGDWVLSAYREKLLRWQLDRLAKLHKMAPLGQQQPRHTRVRWYTPDPTIQNIDLDRIRRDLDSQNPSQDITFDVRVVVLDGQTAVGAYLIPYELLPQLPTLGDVSPYRCNVPT